MRALAMLFITAQAAITSIVNIRCAIAVACKLLTLTTLREIPQVLSQKSTTGAILMRLNGNYARATPLLAHKVAPTRCLFAPNQPNSGAPQA